MSLQDFLDDDTSRFATVALVDTNGLLRGQMVSTRSLKGILKAGMGMAPAQLALDPTDEMLEMPGVTDGTGDFHDDPLIVDPTSARRIPWAKPGHDLLVLTNYSGDTAQICPRSILKSVLDRAADPRAQLAAFVAAALRPPVMDAARMGTWRYTFEPQFLMMPLQAVILITMFMGVTPGMSQVRLVPMPKLTWIRPESAR